MGMWMNFFDGDGYGIAKLIPYPWVLLEPVSILTENSALTGYEYGESPTFSISYGNGDEDVHICPVLTKTN